MNGKLSPLGLTLIFVTAGCLSGPSPKGGDGDGDGDAGIDAPDGGGPNGMPFPGAHSIDLRHVELADVNDDGLTDIYAINQTAVTSDRGVFVFHGPQSDSDDFRYHQFINTNAVPHDAGFYEILGADSLPDLVVLGKRDALADWIIELYQQNVDGTFTPVGSRIVAGFRPNPDTPIILEMGALTGSVFNDFIVADLPSMQVFFVDDSEQNIADGLGNTNSTFVTRDGSSAGPPFENINAIFARPGDTADNLWVVENFDVTRLVNDGAGVLAADPATVNNGSLFPIRAVAEVDFDQDPDTETLDFVGGGLSDFGAWITAPMVDSATIEAADWEYAYAGDLQDIAAGDLGEGIRPEVVVAVGDQGNGSLHVLQDGRRVGSLMSPTSASVHPLGSVATQVVLLNFDGERGNELWAFDGASGAVYCVELIGGAPTDC